MPEISTGEWFASGLSPSLPNKMGVSPEFFDLPLLFPESTSFRPLLERIHRQFYVYAATSPEPLPAPGLIITPEIRSQCELYLPLSLVRRLFYHLYRIVCPWEPNYSSTPFHTCSSWADVLTCLPAEFQFANPARLIEQLGHDQEYLIRFLFASFIPKRFYGSCCRYPGQRDYLVDLVQKIQQTTIRCLDAACGIGETTYDLTGLLLAIGRQPEHVHVEGWSIEPLEIWAAAHRTLPHDLPFSRQFQQQSQLTFSREAHTQIKFRWVDLLHEQTPRHEPFDLILCNGLLGGPIINRVNEMEQIAALLVGLLTPGGCILVADNFHGGWKQRVPEQAVRLCFEQLGLRTDKAGEGFTAHYA